MHRTQLRILITAFSFMLTCSTYAADQKTISHQDNENVRTIDEIGREVKRNSEDVAILRRDQINYRLEKDLLKETYETTLQRITQTISIASSVVALIFAVLAFFGYRNIGKLKDDFSDELQAVRSLKGSLEVEIDVLRRKQEQAEADIARLTRTQGTKIELLEIVEKANNLVRNGNYVWAIEHLKAAQEIDPSHMPLLSLYAMCELKLGNIQSALDKYREIIKTSRLNQGDVLNFAEALLFAKRTSEYDEFYANNQEWIDKAHNGNAIRFFRVLRTVAQGDVSEVKTALQSAAAGCDANASPKLGNWQFDDLDRYVILTMAPGEMKTVVENAKNFFAGSISADQLQAALRS